MTNDSQFTLNIGRRQALNFSVSALATASIAPLANTAVASGYFESSDPVSVLRTLHRMRGSEDGRIAMGWLKGQRYGVVDGEITPLMGMVTGTFARHKVRDDGAVEEAVRRCIRRIFAGGQNGKPLVRVHIARI